MKASLQYAKSAVSKRSLARRLNAANVRGQRRWCDLVKRALDALESEQNFIKKCPALAVTNLSSPSSPCARMSSATSFGSVANTFACGSTVSNRVDRRRRATANALDAETTRVWRSAAGAGGTSIVEPGRENLSSSRSVMAHTSHKAVVTTIHQAAEPVRRACFFVNVVQSNCSRPGPWKVRRLR
jgi:hypothetical protein